LALRAVLLDALGTLMTFAPPAPLLRADLRERVGIEVSEAAAAAAMKAEIAYYRAHLDLGRDAAGLAELRRRSAEAMRPALGIDADGAALTEALVAALRFRAYPDVAPALRALRGLGLRLIVVSNWDVSLHDRLAETGLAPLVDAAVASAELGAAKPDGAIFAHALALAGVEPEAALHVGDSPAEDVGGALAAGLRAVLVARGGAAGAAPPGVPVIASLAELPPLCR
jgi:putative hydrolase of the HAD superfamily